MKRFSSILISAFILAALPVNAQTVNDVIFVKAFRECLEIPLDSWDNGRCVGTREESYKSRALFVICIFVKKENINSFVRDCQVLLNDFLEQPYEGPLDGKYDSKVLIDLFKDYLEQQ